MGLLTKALKTAVKAADAAKDASRTKPKSQMNPLVKARKKPAETDFDKSASQEVKDFLSAVEEKDPNQLGEFYSPVINTLKEMPIGKQGTKGENISAFLNKRAPNVESSERASFSLKLDPQRKYTREEVIDIAKGDGSEEYTISKVNPSGDPMYNEYKGMQRQNVKDKEEEYFVLTVDSTKYLDAAGTKVHFGKPETNLGHTRSSIRIETPAGLSNLQELYFNKNIKDKDRYILIEEMQSDVATDYGKLKKADKKGKAPTSPDVESIDNIVDQNIEIALEELEFDADVGLTIPNSKIINDIKKAHINMHKNNINRFEAGEDLARLLKTEHGIDFKGRAEIDAVSKNAIFNSLETENGIKYGRDSLDVDDTIDGLFDDIETEIQASKQQQKAYEQQQKGLPINPPIETRSDYVKKLILANINYAKRNNINKIVVPDYREIARQRINTFDYAMDQADDSNPTAIKNAELYNDLENGKITQDEYYNIKYDKLAKEYFESIFKKTYQDALKKVLNNLKTETKGAIKIGTRKLEYPAAGNFKGRTSTATEIDITDFDFDPETQALRFNMGGVVPPKNYAEGGVVSMNNQTQQAFALGGLKDEGGEIDEASGNRVPIGGTKEGVRDDIEINISEGEFVFPADVVRYHGLDKMMALRQEAKMGLKQMERMGQMGNSEEATMPDDLPFEMADLIVVGGKGEPMKFANGGFVPEMQTLETAPVPTMGDATSTGTQTPIVYEGYTNPVVTMQEYRDEEGKSIIITFVNGMATIPIPEGYTLYTPPEGDLGDDGTPSEDSSVQDAIKVINKDDDSNQNQFVPQPAPDYRNMNDDEFFAYMTEQNSFGAKAGSAAGLAIAAMIPIPGVGLLTAGIMNNHKNNLMNDMKSRIDRMELGPARTKALAAYKEYGGETDPKKKQGLFASITNFVTGLVTPVANALGINQQDAAKVAQNAAVTEVSGAGSAIESATSAAPTTSLKPMLRPDVSTTAPVTQTGPQGTAIGAFTNQDPRQPTAFPGMGVRVGEGNIQTPTPLKDKSSTQKRIVPITSPLVTGPPQPASAPDRVPDAQAGSGTPLGGYDKEYYTGEKRDSQREPVGNLRTIIPAEEVAALEPNPQEIQDLQARTTDAGIIANEVLARPNEPFLDAAARYARQGFNNYIAGDKTRGIFDPDPVDEQINAAVAGAQPQIKQEVKPNPVVQLPSPITQPAPTPTRADPRDIYSRGDAPNNIQDTGPTGITYSAPATVVDQTNRNYYQTDQAFRVPTAGTVTGPRGGYTQTELQNVQAQREAAALQASPDMFGPIQTKQAFPDYFRDEMEGFEKGDVTGFLETPTQARAREAAAQRTRIQTRNKEIATATAKIPDRIKNSSYYNDQVKRGYTGSTTGGYAVGKIAGSDGNEAGVLQRADGKATKVRDLKGYEGLAGTQRGAMTVFSDAEGTRYTKSAFGKKTKLNGDKYTGPGITQQDKGGKPAKATAKQVTKDGVRYNTSDGKGGTPSKPADPLGNTGGFTSIADMFDGGGPGESAKQERDRGGGDGSSSRVICTELYKQGKLDRDLYRMDVVYTAKHLSPITVRGYHYWAIPMVVRMRSSTLLTNIFEYITIARAKEIAHIVKPQEYKKRSILGYLIKNVSEAICYSIGLFTDQKDWTVLYSKGIVK